ncbi:MAG: hypothetical protein NPINA01_20710 [Nitrospinaceae bacterium]|nr:MAG: hypothetical protein NPINA01_20710 [Nitrospinaceae bacterium]
MCQCAKCGGFWLDCGELAGIQSQFDTEEEQKQAAASYFQTIFDEKIAKMDLMKLEMSESARSIVKIFLFICPEKYLPENTFLLQKKYFSDLNVSQKPGKNS